MDKKYIILGVALLALLIVGILFAVSSCNKKPKTTELNLLTYNEDEKNLKEIVADFAAENNIKVNFIKKEPKNYELDSLNLITTGKVDVWGIPDSWLPKQHDKLASRSGKSDLETYKKLYPAVVQSENIIQNNIYGYPISAEALVLYVNRDLVEKAKQKDNLSAADEEALSNDPVNWDTLTTQARLMTEKNGDTVTTAGLALGTDDIPAAPEVLTVLMMQNGAQMVADDNSQATFHTNVNKFGSGDYPGARALTFYTSFAKPSQVNYAFSQTFGDTLRAFSEGKIAYYIDFSNKENNIKTINPDLNYSVISLPQVKETQNPVDFISYETFTVPSSSPNQTAAWQFIDYLTSEQVLQKYYDTSQKNPIMTDQLNESDIISKAIIDAQAWYNPDAFEIDKIFRSAISQALQGTSSQTALDGAALQVTDLLKKIGH